MRLIPSGRVQRLDRLCNLQQMTGHENNYFVYSNPHLSMRHDTNLDSQYDYLTDAYTTEDQDDDIVLEANADTAHHESMRVVIHTRSDAEMCKQYLQQLDDLRRRNQVLCTKRFSIDATLSF